MSGRDVELQEYKIQMNNCEWELIEKTSKEELEERELPDNVLRVLDFMMTRPVEWKGTTTELYTQQDLNSISVPAFGKHLARNCDFMAGRGIVFTRIRTREESILSLSKAE